MCPSLWNFLFLLCYQCLVSSHNFVPEVLRLVCGFFFTDWKWAVSCIGEVTASFSQSVFLLYVETAAAHLCIFAELPEAARVFFCSVQLIWGWSLDWFSPDKSTKPLMFHFFIKVWKLPWGIFRSVNILLEQTWMQCTEFYQCCE